MTRPAPRTSLTPAPRRATPRASSTTCAASRARVAGARTRPDRRRRRRQAEGLAALDRRPRRRLGDRPRAGGGGGHRQAAGFTTELSRTSPSSSCASDRRAARAGVASRDAARRLLLIDKPAGKTSHDVVASVRRSLPRKTKVGHAGTLDPFATGLLLVLVGRATRAQRYFMEQPKAYETTARLGWTSTTGDPEGELAHTGRIPPDPPSLPTGELRQRPPAYSAIKVGGERAYAKARRGEEVHLPERTVHVARFEQLVARGRARGVRDRVLVGNLRALADRRPRRRVLPGAAPHGYRAIPRRERQRRAADARRRPGSRDPHGRPGRRRRSPRRLWVNAVEAVAPPGAPSVLLAADDGPVAIAEPRDGGLLKPVVGFRAHVKTTLLPDVEPRPGGSRSACSTACTWVTARSSAAPTPS